MMLIRVFGAFIAVVAAVASPVVPYEGGPISKKVTLLDQLVALDREFEPASPASSHGHVEALAARVARCRPGIDDLPSCSVDAVFGPGGLQLERSTRDLQSHFASHALRSTSGSCAALVAAGLALTEPAGGPFEAVVLRDHVLLASRDEPGVYFETLEGGRTLADPDLRRYRMPPSGKPVHVSAQGYIPYYLDNLAARLAEAGRPADAERASVMALGMAPRTGRIHFNYGTLLLRMQRYGEARDHLARAIRLGWDDADAWVNRGVAEWKLGRLRAAERCFRTALKKDPRDGRASANLKAVLVERSTAKGKP